MKYLQPAIGFHVELHEAALLIAIKGYKIIEGTIPSEYGDIMKDLPLLNGATLESLSFYDVFEELMTKGKFFLEDKSLSNKNIFFLRKCGLYGTYHWVHVTAWSDGTYCTSQSPNTNFFIEPWRNNSDRNHLLEDSIFFILQSKKELFLN